MNKKQPLPVVNNNMTIQEFIEKAYEGGWRGNVSGQKFDDKLGVVDAVDLSVEELVLDPKAWQALGKVEGWKGKCAQEFTDGFSHSTDCALCIAKGWIDKMHDMITALIDGKTLEEYIQTL